MFEAFRVSCAISSLSNIYMSFAAITCCLNGLLHWELLVNFHFNESLNTLSSFFQWVCLKSSVDKKHPTELC